MPKMNALQTKLKVIRQASVKKIREVEKPAKKIK